MYGSQTKHYKKNPVHTRQHGFRADRNTVTAISEVTDFIEQNIFFNKHVLAVFLDIQAAFDTISPEKIKSALKEHGINPLVTDWYYNYITTVSYTHLTLPTIYSV